MFKQNLTDDQFEGLRLRNFVIGQKEKEVVIKVEKKKSPVKMKDNPLQTKNYFYRDWRAIFS